MGLLYGMRTLIFLGFASMNFVALRRGRQYHNLGTDTEKCQILIIPNKFDRRILPIMCVLYALSCLRRGGIGMALIIHH
jgi:hypothetical protein